MQAAIRLHTKVLPGNRIEVVTPELPENSDVELVILLSQEASGGANRYPAALMADYDSLIKKKLDRTLTEPEATRLQDVRNVIAAIDRLADPEDIRERRMRQLDDELAQMQAELEALPDA